MFESIVTLCSVSTHTENHEVSNEQSWGLTFSTDKDGRPPKRVFNPQKHVKQLITQETTTLDEVGSRFSKVGRKLGIMVQWTLDGNEDEDWNGDEDRWWNGRRRL